MSKINSLAHLRAAPCNDLHATKLAPGECPLTRGWGRGWTLGWELGVCGPSLSLLCLSPFLGKEKEPLESQYQVGPLLGSGGFGSVYSGIRVADNLPVSGRPTVGRARRAEEWGLMLCFGPSKGI